MPASQWLQIMQYEDKVELRYFVLQDPMTLARFGFLYRGYTITYFEVWDMLRKLMIAGIPALVPSQPFGSTQVSSAG